MPVQRSRPILIQALLFFSISSNFLIYLFSTLLGKFGPAQYYQLGAITIAVVPPVSANRLLINMYDSAHAEPERDTMRSVVQSYLLLMYLT